MRFINLFKETKVIKQNLRAVKFRMYFNFIKRLESISF